MYGAEWLGCQRWPVAAAAAICGKMANAPPVAMSAVTKRQEMADKMGKSINCLSERRIAKLSRISAQLRENLPMARSFECLRVSLAEWRAGSNSTGDARLWDR